ncbi:DUF5995 family protein [Streptomyces mashuensis]|uniref:DUF5995 family protein n=1 Tax=Streptomyces mashuensis TaxID=33904 RepID=UPI00167D4160|nr:DUF5995 family protein [Streptomyces mashuensis]
MTGVRKAVAAGATAALLWLGGTVPAPAVPAAGVAPCTGRGSPEECVAAREAQLAALRDRLGCDHRAPFAAIYARLETTLGQVLRERPPVFAEPSWIAGLDDAFADRYLAAFRADESGRPVPEAWRIAFAVARTGRADAGQDALLGANAHIQRDLPHVLVALGLVRPDGTSRKGDYDRAQIVLDRAYGPVVRELARRYDPFTRLVDDRWNPVAGYTAHQLFVLWRQNAWAHARRLAAARGAAERDAAARAIETDAATWARLLSTVQVPGHRAVRDAYCRGGGGA